MNICSCSLAGTKACMTCPSNNWSNKHEQLFWGTTKSDFIIDVEKIKPFLAPTIDLYEGNKITLPSGSKYIVKDGDLVEHE